MKNGFEVVDEARGIFSLWDKAFGQRRTWKVDDEATPGMWMAQEKAEIYSKKIQDLLPKNGELTAEERTEHLRSKIEALPDDERDHIYEMIRKNSARQIAIMCMYVEPVDPPMEEGLFCGLWETKMEYLASCLSRPEDSIQISSFFLKRLNISTESPKPKEAKSK